MTCPIIIDNKWGYIKIKFKNKIYEYGKNGERADVILWKNGVQKWNWKKKSTFCDHHYPGISLEAVKYLEKKNCDIIILSKGYGDPTFKSPGVLQTQSNIKKYLKDRKIKFHNLKSETAAKKWNHLIKNKENIGMLFHSTC